MHNHLAASCRPIGCGSDTQPPATHTWRLATSSSAAALAPPVLLLLAPPPPLLLLPLRLRAAARRSASRVLAASCRSRLASIVGVGASCRQLVDQLRDPLLMV
jgi:hypothetical protein